jgi:hypothetical protein
MATDSSDEARRVASASAAAISSSFKERKHLARGSLR